MNSRHNRLQAIAAAITAAIGSTEKYGPGKSLPSSLKRVKSAARAGGYTSTHLNGENGARAEFDSPGFLSRRQPFGMTRDAFPPLILRTTVVEVYEIVFAVLVTIKPCMYCGFHIVLIPVRFVNYEAAVYGDVVADWPEAPRRTVIAAPWYGRRFVQITTVFDHYMG